MWPVVIDARQREASQRDAKPAVPVRIGDAERDEAVSKLGDHFAAGRLSREELDERIDKAMQARFGTDLEPLFADLPSPEPENARPQPGQLPSPRPMSLLFLLVPVIVVSLVIVAIATGAPWLLWGLVWLLILGRFGRRHWGGPRGGWHEHRPGPPARYR
jgi:hypothetical protein